jgi:large subunit ribosomal protein L21
VEPSGTSDGTQQQSTSEMTMYAVVSSGGKQYRVEAGSTLTLERLDGEPGGSITFDRVLLIGDGDEVTVGTPVVAGASVSATVLGEELGPKLVIFKFKQKVKYRRRTGHRQHLTRVRIDAIHPTAARKTAAPSQAAEHAPKAARGPKVEKASIAAKAPAKPMPKPKAAAPAAKPRAARAVAPAGAEPEAVKPKPRRTAKAKVEE